MSMAALRSGDNGALSRFQPDSRPMLAAHQAHVWSAEVRPGCDLSALEAVLSDDERYRAGSFRTTALRDIYIAAHGTLRLILATSLGKPADRLAFTANAWGKPRLVGADADIHFNLSHSGNRFLIAVSRSGPIGVDIERIASEPPYEIETSTFTQFEQSRLDGLPPQSRKLAFYDFWARKEAVIKGVGRGLAMDLQEIDVALGVDRACSPAGLSGNCSEEGAWYVWRLPAISGFASALASQDSRLAIRFEEIAL